MIQVLSIGPGLLQIMLQATDLLLLLALGILCSFQLHTSTRIERLSHLKRHLPASRTFILSTFPAFHFASLSDMVR